MATIARDNTARVVDALDDAHVRPVQLESVEEAAALREGRCATRQPSQARTSNTK